MKMRSDPRQRVITTPEGLALSFTLAGRGARFAALALDLFFMMVMLVVIVMALGFTAGGIANLDHKIEAKDNVGHAIQFLVIVLIAFVFLLRNGWFLFFELGPRGATPGKRITGIRIAARNGGRLSTEMVLARNLLRDIEIFLPLFAVTSALGSSASESVNWIMAGWFLIFALFPCFNRDSLRAGDLVAGTCVVETPRRKLEASLSTAPAATPAVSGYAFRDSDLGTYGEYELQTLERVLRDGKHEALEAVARAICVKIGWTPPQGEEVRPFLDAYYTALRERLEQGMRFGKRKADKFDGS
jgi:uncharacterized RDD family membrane protein YckC